MKKLLALLFLIPFLATITHADDDAASKRKTAEQILENLRLIDAAIDQYAIENKKTAHTPVAWADIKLYLKPGTYIYNSEGKDLLGNPYNDGKFAVGEIPKVNKATFKALSDVADINFWSPYY